MQSLNLLSSWLRVTPVGLHSPAFPQSVRTCERAEAGSHRLVHHRVQLTSREGFSGLGRAPTTPSIELSAQCPLSDLISYLLPLAHSVLPTLTLLAFQFAKQSPFSGPSHLLFPPPGTCFPQKFTRLAPHLFHISGPGQPH